MVILKGRVVATLPVKLKLPRLITWNGKSWSDLKRLNRNYGLTSKTVWRALVTLM